MTLTMDMTCGHIPKRGDLIQTNVGDRRERTCFVLRARQLKPRCVPRYKLWVVRWWEIEPSFRNLLFRSAERNGGQAVIYFKRYRATKKKKTFEQYMRSK